MQEVNRRGCTLQRVTRDTRQATTLATDGYIEALVPLLAQLRYRHILADLNTALDIHAYLAHDIYLGFDDILIQLVGRNAIAQHSSWLFVTLKHGRFVSHRGEVICTA